MTSQTNYVYMTLTCRNGASKSGLFCAVSSMLDRMQRDQEVDLFQTVMTNRTNRPQFIEDIVSYLHLSC